MKKRVQILLCVLLALWLLPRPARAAAPELERLDPATGVFSPIRAQSVSVMLSGERLSADVPAVLLAEGWTAVPLRALGEALGARVHWDPSSGSATLSGAGATLTLTPGNSSATVNGKRVVLPAGQQVFTARAGGAERTMAPLRFVAQALGARVDWDGAFTAAYITPSGSFTTPIRPGRYTIALDPGHGGDHSGAVYEGVMEKTVNQAVARLLRARLEELGYRVVMTLEGDETLGLYQRCDLANAAGADIFISLHSNASDVNPTAQGLHTYYYPTSARGRALAQAIQGPACAVSGAADRGILSEDFVVVRETKMPAVLVEMGFLSTHQELLRLVDPEYQQKLAVGIAEGVVRYLNGL